MLPASATKQDIVLGSEVILTGPRSSKVRLRVSDLVLGFGLGESVSEGMVGMLRVRLRGWITYAEESPHKDRSTRVCVCVCNWWAPIPRFHTQTVTPRKHRESHKSQIYNAAVDRRASPERSKVKLHP